MRRERFGYTSPLVVGVPQGRPAIGDPVTPALHALGRNTGNILFSEAMFRLLSGARRGTFALTASELEDRDCIVVAAANWINSFEDLSWLADRLERTRLPVVLIGIGAQSTLRFELSQLRPGTRRLLEMVRDHGHAMAARGAFSCEVLQRLGFPGAVETGCPSLMLAGPFGPRLSGGGRGNGGFCLHATRHASDGAEPLQAFLYRQAFRHRHFLVLQSEIPDICLATDAPESALLGADTDPMLRDSYGTDDRDAISHYLRHHGRAFFNYPDWILFMRGMRFCLGTRIHGTIAALLAGTPALLICHDARTTELAHSMGIPHLPAAGFETSRDLDPDRLDEMRTDLHQQLRTFETHYTTYYERFLRYLAINDLPIADGFGHAADASSRSSHPR